jgi:hypothetical protein
MSKWFSAAKDATIANGTSYLPGGTSYYTNPGYEEMQCSLQRLSETGSGALTITLEEYDPTADDFYPLEDGAGNAVTFLAYAADETDTAGVSPAAGERQLLRLGKGIIGGDADGVLAIAGSESNWYDYTPPMFFRFKVVEAGTTSVINLHVALLGR